MYNIVISERSWETTSKAKYTACVVAIIIIMRTVKNKKYDDIVISYLDAEHGFKKKLRRLKNCKNLLYRQKGIILLTCENRSFAESVIKFG